MHKGAPTALHMSSLPLRSGAPHAWRLAMPPYMPQKYAAQPGAPTCNDHGQALLRQRRLDHLSRPVDRHNVAAGRRGVWVGGWVGGRSSECLLRAAQGRAAACQPAGHPDRRPQSERAALRATNTTAASICKGRSPKRTRARKARRGRCWGLLTWAPPPGRPSSAGRGSRPAS